MRRGTERRTESRSAPRPQREGVAVAQEPGRRALVVDDDDETREYLRDLLGLCGYEVETASDAAGARALIARRVPDVLLIDVMMPREDGVSLLRSIREEEGLSVPALFVTARGGGLPSACGRALNAAVVRKPFRASDLLDAVTRAVTRTA